jgi:integrase
MIQQFLFIIGDKGIKLSDISHKTIIDYLHYMKSCRPSGLNSIIPTIRDFLEYLYKNKLTFYEFNKILTIRNLKRTVVKPLIKTEEADQILSCIDTSTNQGKRDYAIFTLAKYNGLRSSDILNLKLQDINWKDAEITIIQRKTNQALIVPINVSTGNSIADYILNSRPYSNLPYVFLKICAPFNQLTSGNLCLLLKKYMRISGVHCTSNDWKSVHSFRRALGTNMLEADVPTSMITQVLGHKSPESIKAYLSLSDHKLSECPLDLSDIEFEGLL